jgi:hypothetical protein
MFVDFVAFERVNCLSFKRTGVVPSVICFKNSKENILLYVLQSDCLKVFYSGFKVSSKVIRIFFGDHKYYVRIQSFQVHHLKKVIQSIIFCSLTPSDIVSVDIPIKIIGNGFCKDLQEGSVLKQKVKSVVVSCLFGCIPDFFVIDVSLLKKGESLFFKDFPLYSNMVVYSKNKFFEETYIIKVI